VHPGRDQRLSQPKVSASQPLLNTVVMGTDGRPTADQELIKTYFGLLLEPYMEEIKKRWAADVTLRLWFAFSATTVTTQRLCSHSPPTPTSIPPPPTPSPTPVFIQQQTSYRGMMAQLCSHPLHRVIAVEEALKAVPDPIFKLLLLALDSPDRVKVSHAGRESNAQRSVESAVFALNSGQQQQGTVLRCYGVLCFHHISK
jgi:hypothetical protein